MLPRILWWWAYRSSICTLKEAIAPYATYYYESLCRNIHRRKQKEDINIDLNRIDDAMLSGVKWLESIQRKDGCIGGRLWENWDTANAVLALTSTGIESDAIEPAVNFLLQSQLDNGGFFYECFPASREDIKDRRDLYCIETTPVALMGIYKYEGKITSEIRRCLDFLYEKQRECGGWELPYMGDPKVVNTKLNYFPSVTGYALRAILLIDKNPLKPVLEKALNFMEETQHKNGSWSRSFSFYNTEGYAIRNMVSALTSMQASKWSDDVKLKIEKMLDSPISYTKRMQNADGSWSAISIASKATSTSLFLQTLLTAKRSLLKLSLERFDDKRYINLAVDWLLRNQEEKGFWKGGYYGHLVHPYLGYINEVNNDVFATSEALVALSEYKKLQERLSQTPHRNGY